MISPMRFRILASEINVMAEVGFFPASNLFFMDSISPEEKKDLIDASHIDVDIIKNRLQNVNISAEEREVLEGYL